MARVSSSRSPIITRDFLEKILDKTFSHSSITVGKYSVRRSRNAGYASDMYFIDVDYMINSSRELKTTSLVMKCPPCGGQHQDYVCQSSAFVREITALSDVIPKMQKILTNISDETFEPFAPKLFHSQLEPYPMLVMENLTDYEMPDQRQGLDFDTCVRVLKTLARFHAASVVLHDRSPESMDVFRKPFFLEKPLAREHWTKVLTGLSRAFAVEIASWSEFHIDISKKLHSFTDGLMDTLEQMLQPNENGFNVLTHSDLWTNNMFIRYCYISGNIDHIKFIDYQNSHFTSPVVDLHYFLTSCPSFDIRLDHDELFLDEYHNELSRILRILGYKGRWLSLAELKEEFDRRTAHSLFVAVTDLAMFLTESGFQYDSAIQDEGKTVKNKVFESKLYRRTMNKLLPHYIKKGVI